MRLRLLYQNIRKIIPITRLGWVVVTIQLNTDIGAYNLNIGNAVLRTLAVLAMKLYANITVLDTKVVDSYALPINLDCIKTIALALKCV